MLSNKKTSTQLSLEKEERERRELHKIMMGNAGQDDGKDRDGKKDKRKKGDEELSTTGEDGGMGRTAASVVRTEGWGGQLLQW